eukprot:7833228-Pyramimonas_sp.AAC.1
MHDGRGGQSTSPPQYYADQAPRRTPSASPPPLSPLQVLWGVVLQGIDYELAGRHDLAQSDATPFVGRHGPPQFKWRTMKWRPPRKRQTWGQRTHDWATIKRWVQHLRSE